MKAESAPDGGALEIAGGDTDIVEHVANILGHRTLGTPDTHPLGPEQHQEALRALGLRKVDDLLVLSRNTDPFFKGTPAHWRDGHWFAGLWQHFGSARGVHIRRMHYRAMTVGYPKPDGTPYQNTPHDWGYLELAAASARILGLVDVEVFADKRNAPPLVHRQRREVPPEEVGFAFTEPSWYLPEFDPDAFAYVRLELPTPSAEGYDYDPDDQPVLVELWVEKSTMDDVLVPVCRSLHVNLLTGTGFQSISATVSLLRRAQRYGKPVHVIYVSDFDPAGVVMPVAVARQAQFWAERLNIDAELTLHPVVLTREQVAAYDLPRAPVGLTKRGVVDPRGKVFEERNGEGVVELDALEALHPGELAQIVRRAVRPYIDRDLAGRLASARAEAQSVLDDAWEQVVGPLAEEVARLESEARAEAESIAAELAALVNERLGRLEPLRLRGEELRAQASRRLAERLDVELPVRPEPAEPEVDRDALLYDSRRCWLDQLAAYRRAKGHSSPDGAS